MKTTYLNKMRALFLFGALIVLSATMFAQNPTPTFKCVYISNTEFKAYVEDLGTKETSKITIDLFTDKEVKTYSSANVGWGQLFESKEMFDVYHQIVAEKIESHPAASQLSEILVFILDDNRAGDTEIIAL